MFKKFIPYAHSQSIYEIEIDFYKRNGITTLFMDLDNTLDSYRAREPKPQTIEYVSELKKNKITPIIISNNKAKRVSGYANLLGVEFLSSARKPFSRRIKAEIVRRNLKKDEVMLVGDQLMTDVLAAKGAGIKVVLTEKLVKEDQWTTHINRLIDRPIRKYHRKRNNLINWRER